jgi:CheY-like chemotaxis protein
MSDSTGPSPVVVVLDDNLLFSSGLVAVLKRLGYTARVIDREGGAVSRVAAARPVIILVNLASRGWDGVALVRQLRATSDLAGVPIVGFTGHTEVAQIEAARAAGCNRVVANSAISSDLGSVLRSVLPLPGQAKE